jgi:hypothetical protein
MSSIALNCNNYITMKSLGSHIPAPIASQLAQLQKINRALYELIPIEFLGHIQVGGNPQNGTLHVYADSSAWATKLRFYKPTIVAGLAMHTRLAIKSVHIAINPQTSDHKTKPLKRPSLSRNSAKLLATLAKDIEDPELKRALSALAKHLPGK